ncbi:flagellar biosynthesis anti-sigma factor FlgM [Citrobacter rodentium]|uniref:Negative regulator of flagellin synthesis n=3 Tax=Citrobacter rodentium TaxID=67825 RepID=D2TJ79_CITRI|nr:flagellar biosynthesis anti-sigma factor FlgM [Citrobacter rodentium]QBY31541.1 flagellar biosynthesis anti-sigma factor FlgM [Citrobacter rodentium]UHO31103.1 flagellar biosynthesis anti-sigma factor FlgM [Citrobacter rodentium NBRC 105723 = DSM 16636]CBG87086.1 lateral flagellar anti-sigma factor 28 protein [Citrobacter rodentium ICC168]HAT8014120.1 flagellar biosynthesis anti-sigma factor FlgM [Citrobacter rodentium NBRC 105723 = DSM 16636]HAT8019057.1 flagellar biosynthesis anti-sigma f
MKITPTLSGNRPTPAAADAGNSSKNSAARGAVSATSLSADDITQAGLQSAQQALNDDGQGDIDYDKVAQMQAALAAGELSVDTDQLAGDMLNFFR